MSLMSNQNFNALKPGEINLSLIPVDWPLTPLGEIKTHTKQAGKTNHLQSMTLLMKSKKVFAKLLAY